MKKIAILQSNYIPWKGYFDLIAAVNEFIIYDDMQFTKNDWRNRNQIKTPQGIQWLTVPVGQGIRRRIRDVTLSDGWQIKHWKSLESNYRRAAHFDAIASWLRPLYLETSYTHLSQLNNTLIKAICEYLNINTRISFSWDYQLGEGRTERLVNLCLQAGASEYISGPSAKDYLQVEQFQEQGINLRWLEYSDYREYPQLWGSFDHRVSILDLLFNCGKGFSNPNEVRHSMRLSIVATLYQSAPHLREFHARCSSAAQTLAGDNYEIVLVNDGSPDDSLAKAIQLTETDPHVVLIDLSRNFGHHKAMMTGLAHARGDRVFLIDSDLEEQPECLLTFQKKLCHSEACDMVYGVQEQRKGRWFERLSGGLFWKLINWLSDLSLSANMVTARLMTRRYVDALLLHQEREVFMAGLWHITGFVQEAVIVQKLSSGRSTYTLRRKLALLVNSVTSFSALPLVAIFYLGLMIFSFACCYTAYLVIHALLFSYTMAGWTSVMVSIWLLGGLVLSCMGIIGIYLSKVFSESKRRPYTIVRKIYGR